MAHFVQNRCRSRIDADDFALLGDTPVDRANWAGGVDPLWQRIQDNDHWQGYFDYYQNAGRNYYIAYEQRRILNQRHFASPNDFSRLLQQKHQWGMMGGQAGGARRYLQNHPRMARAVQNWMRRFL